VGQARVALIGSIVAIGVAGAFWITRRPAPPHSLRHDSPPAAPSETPEEAPPRVVTPAPPALSEEAQIMARLRIARDSDSALCIELAREGNRRFPDSPQAAERASILIHALARLGRSSEARREAEAMVNRYPDSDWLREIEQFTGAHRRRNLRRGEDGGIETY
jgi:hypothetical protein